MSDDWYILHKGRALGPHSLDSLRSAAESGALQDDARVRCGTDGEWIYAIEVPGLFASRRHESAARAGQMVCSQCGTLSSPAAHTPGSTAVEAALWLTFFVPGIIYSVWRRSSRGHACPACGCLSLVPPNSPAGRRLLGNMQ